MIASRTARTSVVRGRPPNFADGMEERGVEVDHSSLNRWVLRAPRHHSKLT
jgi:hypothetical protein